MFSFRNIRAHLLPSLSFLVTALLLHASRLRMVYGGVFIILIGIPLVWGVALFRAPSQGIFPTIITIEQGETFGSIAEKFTDAGIVWSPTLLRFAVRIVGDDTAIQAGSYVFYEPLGALFLAERLVTGDLGADTILITLPEGITVRDMAVIFSTHIPGFDADTFIREALPLEGYLFPDTYQFTPLISEKDIVARLYATFMEKILPYEERIDDMPYDLHEIITMASILEKEARTAETKRRVAGVLWNRIEVDMPLQVDAVFGYIFNRPTFHPSLEDLEIDSPYNTYRYRGLPPGPIGNPGIVSIEAALNPTSSEYFFYLTGRDGVMYYARDFEGHRENRRRYLD